MRGERLRRASVVPWDFKWPAEETAAFILEHVQPGSIVDLHDGRPANDPPDASSPTREETVRALASVLEVLTTDGYR